MHDFLYCFIRLILGLCLIAIGVIFLFIPWSEGIRLNFIHFIEHDCLAIFFLGISLIVIGFFALANIAIRSRHTFYRIKTGNTHITIEESVILQYVISYIKGLCSTENIPVHVRIKKNQFHISIEFPHQPIPEQKLLLERVKSDLTSLFSSKLGYHDPFWLSISFNP